MFPRRFQSWARGLAEHLVVPLARRGVTPNKVTVVGFVLNVATACVLASGHLAIGGAMLFVAGVFDMLDGALARVTAAHSDFGAFLDSMLDRYSEATVLLALIFQFTIRHDVVPVLLVYIVAVGSLLISYARARAEGLGIEARVGIAPRPERVIILGLGLLLNGFIFQETMTIAALSILAILTHVTAMQRLHSVWQQTRPESTTQRSVTGKAKRRTRTT